jgi:hypothetical protein
MVTVHACHICGDAIKIAPGLNAAESAKASLDARADHYATHNPSPAQWTEAYNKNQAAKDKTKKAERDCTRSDVPL